MAASNNLAIIFQFEDSTVLSSEAVAKVQAFFGLERTFAKEISCNGSESETPTDGSNVSKENGQRGPIKTMSSQENNNGTIDQQKFMSYPKSQMDYQVSNYVWYCLFHFGAFLGDDAFYYTFFPFWLFNINSYVIRRVLLLWAITMYVGQSSKEILKWPRPQSPPVVPLEPRYFKEYGMPSTHAMVGVLIPFSILFLTMDKVEYSIPIGFLVAMAWTTLVCLSRLYKGMHYILDVVVGVVLTFALLGMVFPFLDKIDHYLMTDKQAPLLLASAITFLSLTYPSQRGWSSTREDTIVILSVTGSIYTSLWLNNYFQWFPDRYNDDLPSTITWPTLAQWGAMFCREFLGVAITLLVHCIIKPIMLEILSFVYSIEINSETKKYLSVEFPYKYVTYTVVVLVCMLVSPFVFSLVGL